MRIFSSTTIVLHKPNHLHDEYNSPMNFLHHLYGASLIVIATVAQPTWSFAYDSTLVNDIANNTTVRIDINAGNDNGSGVIIARTGSTYYVLTADHVVKNVNFQYEIVTPDGEKHLLNESAIKSIGDRQVDMAVISFESENSYKIAQLETSANRIRQGTPIYINGFPKEGRQVEAGPQFTSGIITGINENHCSGYNLVYNNVTQAGMSGGPIFNEQAKVIGIHGLAEEEKLENDVDGCTANEEATETRKQIDFNLGISVATFLNRVEDLGMSQILDSTNTGGPERPTEVPNDPNADSGCSGTDNC